MSTEIAEVPMAVAEVMTLPLTNATALAQALDAYSAARTVLLRWIASELVAGSDYMVIHRRRDCRNAKDPKTTPCPACGSKATLLQPGAQKLCGLLRVVPTFERDRDTWEMLSEEDRTAGTLVYVCHLHQGHADGPVVSEGRGSRATAQDQGVVNTSVKMAQKSAMVDATIRLGGLSDAYTQDLEDLRPVEPAPSAFGEPPRKALAAEAIATIEARLNAKEAVKTLNAQMDAEDYPPLHDPPPAETITFDALKAQHQVFARLRTMAASSKNPSQRFDALRNKLKERIGKDLGKEHFHEMTAADYAVVGGWLDAAQKIEP